MSDARDGDPSLRASRTIPEPMDPMDRTDAIDPRDQGESRRSFRPPVTLRWPVELERVGEPGSRTWATTRNVSVGGAFVESDLRVPIGTALHIWLHPPRVPTGTQHILKLRGEVRWLSPGHTRDLPRGFGVAFRGLTITDEVALHGCFTLAYKVV